MNIKSLLAGVVLLALTAACTTGEPDDGTDAESGTAKEITVWTIEDVQDRLIATQKLADAFAAKSGIKVKLVAIAEAQFDQIITSAAAGGTLPDVVAALGPAAVQSMSVNGLLDTKTPGEIVKDLGEDTFSAAALDFARSGDDLVAVPSDAWTQLLYYRKDLFTTAGLAAPDTYEKILTAAKALTRDGVAGIALSTKAGDASTQQAFERLALGNGCELVDDAGTVTLDSPACQETFALYGDLARNYSPKGNQDTETTRANYFAGKTAMVMWSTFLLDELAGLRNDALPTCAPCKNDPAFLAKNTGVVGELSGPSGQPSQYGQVASWVLTKAGNAAASKAFVKYMMDDAYVDWLAIAPEGKAPVRKGTPAEPQKFTNAWAGLKAGVDRKAPLSQFYSPEVVQAILTGPEKISLWGFPQGQGALVGAIQGQLPVPKAVNAIVNGEDPRKAASDADAAVTEIAKSLK